MLCTGTTRNVPREDFGDRWQLLHLSRTPRYPAHSEMLREELFLAQQLKDTETTVWSKETQVMSEFGTVHIVLVL